MRFAARVCSAALVCGLQSRAGSKVRNEVAALRAESEGIAPTAIPANTAHAVTQAIATGLRRAAESELRGQRMLVSWERA
jgi:hypothetical protein